MKFLAAVLLLCALNAGADERVTVCFNYGCLTQADVIYSDAQLGVLGMLLGGARYAAV